MKLKRFSVLFGFIASVAIFSSCRQDLLESPSFYTRGSYSKGTIASPEKVSATQGGYRSITLTWSSSKSAKNYEIWSSETATGEFKKIGETSDATCSYTSGDAPGVLKYFRVKAVDYNDVVSEFSTTCFGTTLATPAITWVKQNANGDAITVKWYKGANCTQNTYLNNELFYTVILWNSDATKVLKEVTISAEKLTKDSETMYTFTELEPNTVYNVQVKAYTKLDQNQTENSDPENQSTAHSLIPAAPENFTVEKGTSKEFINLSWTLPKFAEIKVSSAYETRPVYFKILRKLESEPDYAYEPIVSYLGAIEQKSHSASVIYFKKKSDANPGDANSTVMPAKAPVSVEYLAEQTETDANYPNYVPGTKITYSDKTADTGKKYSYRIQSYIDDNGNKLITSDESYSDESGWLINSPTVSVSSTYKEKPKETEDEPTKIESFTVTLNFKFDDFGQPYNYVITETCQKMIKATEKELNNGEQDKPDGEPTITKPNSTSYSNFFPWTRTYEPLNETNAYLLYTYDVAVCPKNSSDDDTNHYIKVSAPGSVIVINDKSMIPDVSSFKVEDGYKDKFKLSWDYDPNCKYILSWKNTDKNGNETSNEYEFQETDFVDDDGKPIKTKTNFEYDHKAESGDIRTQYTLNADNGLKNHKTAKDENENMEFKTLGTPEPYFEPSYTSIKVIWQAVQKADSTKYVAKYKSGNNEEITIPTQSIKTDDEGKTFYCEITKPYGETTTEKAAIDNATDATIAGKDIEFILTAGSNVDTCDTTIPISTLGPANLDLKIIGDRKTITLTWNKVEGAKGYLIFRKKYIKDYFDTEDDKGDLYYCSDENNQENLSVTLIGADAEASASCASNTTKTIKFTDKYQPVTEDYYNDQYRTAQAQLAWGLPYGYTVIPVKNSSDFEFDDDYAIQGTSASIAYTADSLLKVEKKGATYGYGLAIEASKATTNNEVNENYVELSWKPSFNTSSKPTILYRNYDAENGTDWAIIEEPKKDNYFECKLKDLSETLIANTKNKNKVFDYMVYYNLGTNIEIDPYYEYFLSERKDSDGEKKNKGYIFSFETPRAMYAGSDNKDDPDYYAEKFVWQLAGINGFNIYNTEERKKKPDLIELFILNTNKSIGWKKIAEINPDTLEATITMSQTDLQQYDLQIETDSNSMKIAPNSIKNNGATNTNGLLKVLRDAKHYYKIEGCRTDPSTEKLIYAKIGDNRSIYAYRQITDEELAKATMLAFTDGMEKIGKLDFNDKTVINDVLYSHHESQTSKKYTQYYINYKPLYTTPYGKESSMLGITTTSVAYRNMHTQGGYPVKIDNTEINVSLADENIENLSSYNNTVTFSLSDEKNATIKCGNFSKTITDKEERRYWAPMRLYNDDSWYNKVSKYGWWED